MKLLVLYEELAGYFLACINAFVEKENAEVLIIHKETNTVAPFQFAPLKSVRTLDRSKIDEKNLNNLVLEFSPDVIFCAGWGFKSYLEICRKFQINIPVILGFDNWWIGSMKQRLSTNFAKFFFSKRFNRCFVPASHQKEFALRLGFSERRIARGAYCCDFIQFNNYFKENAASKKTSFPKRFIFVGRYVTEKGIVILWNAFLEIQKESPNEWELWCFGKGDLKAVDHPKIKHFGFVQPAEMEMFIQQTGVFVLPSIFEPWGVVAHEFAAAGFPLILSDQVGAAEFFLRENQNGFMIKHGDSESLKIAMKSMIGMNDEKLFEMAENSNRLASTITPQKWSETLYELIYAR